jgi:hypothetical protein
MLLWNILYLPCALWRQMVTSERGTHWEMTPIFVTVSEGGTHYAKIGQNLSKRNNTLRNSTNICQNLKGKNIIRNILHQNLSQYQGEEHIKKLRRHLSKFQRNNVRICQNLRGKNTLRIYAKICQNLRVEEHSEKFHQNLSQFRRDEHTEKLCKILRGRNTLRNYT